MLAVAMRTLFRYNGGGRGVDTKIESTEPFAQAIAGKNTEKRVGRWGSDSIPTGEKVGVFRGRKRGVQVPNRPHSALNYTYWRADKRKRGAFRHGRDSVAEPVSEK